MYIRNLFKNLDKKFSKIKVSGISFNSSTIKKNNIFFAIKGEKFDGNDFIDDAIKKGAKVIISEKVIKISNSDVVFLKTKNIRKLLAKISFQDLKKKPKSMIAVTGTNGKSSVSDFYFQILNLQKYKVASIGTIGVRTNNELKKISNTTLDPINLKNFINKLTHKNIDNIILEASSHGLKQNRLDGLFFDIGIFTNFSHDHLDYHKNFKDYLNSKLYLFKNLIKNNGVIISDSTITQFKKINRISKQKKIKLLSVFGKNSDLELISHKFKEDFQIIQI
ncbi:UDP-N-acetylmuramoyl-L-alanyl-D-glutamate--2,6-diaminopimelate ligase, partial [Pelagibacterales bacterium SAG-MED13]|nr:UDP-N-acetylmuramoyl-L-alanyl-D-glutamate--2,6-diaminopimelate ligase [Pelagibacterales bacterium SAG-MED13]